MFTPLKSVSTSDNAKDRISNFKETMHTKVDVFQHMSDYVRYIFRQFKLSMSSPNTAQNITISNDVANTKLVHRNVNSQIIGRDLFNVLISVGIFRSLVFIVPFWI